MNSTQAVLSLIERSVEPLQRTYQSKIAVQLGGVLEALVQSPEAHGNLEAFWATELIGLLRDGKGIVLTAREAGLGHVTVLHDGSHHGYYLVMQDRYINDRIHEAFSRYQPPAGFSAMTSHFVFHVDLYADTLGARPVAVLLNEVTSEWRIEPFEPFDLPMGQVTQSTINMLQYGELDLGDILVTRPGNPRANVY